MNKTYRLVWSALKNVWVATAETVRGRGKQGPSRVALALAGLLGLAGAAAQAAGPAATALPTGGQVVAGQATVTQGGASMAITQGSNRAAIDWASFNVGSQAQVNIQQPSANAVLLNRVTGNDASQIFGRINANGQVFLSNPNGVYFAPGASVDVGGLVATTHRIGLDEFMAGNLRFERNGATGSVINEGELKAALGGYIALLAPEVRNQGVIVAQLGTVALAAGEAFELQFDGNRTLAGLRVEAATIRTLVDNRSAVLAPGGLVILSAQAMNSVQGGVVRNSGRIEATGLAQRGGRIVLEASSQVVNSGRIDASATAQGPAGNVRLQAPEVVNSGSIEAKGSAEHPAGGQVSIVAGNVVQEAPGRIDVSAPLQGGTVQVQASGLVSLAGSVSAAATAAVAPAPVAAATTPTAPAEAAQGGEITVQAAQISVASARLDAAGEQRGGRIVLDASAPAPAAPPAPLPAPEPGKVALLGSSELSSRSRRGQGGSITVLGQDIGLLDQTSLDASGATGGGVVRVGGGWQGGEGLHQATTVAMAAGAAIDASATQQGDGGSVVLWSDVANTAGSTAAHGSIGARGAGSGNGGQIETSGHQVDSSGARIDAGTTPGAGGRAGQWLIDPADSIITQAIADSYVTSLNTGTSVLNEVSGSMTWSSGVSLAKTAGGDATLTLKTGGSSTNNITLNSANISSSSGALNLVLWTRSTNTGAAGSVNILSSTINTNGGHLWVGGTDTISGANNGSTTWNGLTVGNGRSASWANDTPGVFVQGGSINTGAGSIYLAGDSYQTANYTGGRNFGVWIDTGSTLSTTSGSIRIDGTARGKYNDGAGVILGFSNGVSSAGNILLSTGSGSIDITGVASGAQSSGGTGVGLYVRAVAAGDQTVIKSASGGITLNGGSTQTGSIYASGMQLETENNPTGRIQVLSQSGAIALIGSNSQEASNQSTSGIRLAPSNVAGSIQIGDDGSNAYSGNILIQTNTLLQRVAGLSSAGAIAVRSSGTLTIEPLANSFVELRSGSGTLSFDNDWNFGTALSGFTLGKPTNTSALSLSNALSVAGGINLYGGAISLTGALTSTGAGDINVNGSALTIAAALTKSSDGNVNLNGGTVSLGGAVASTGTGDVNISGSTLTLSAALTKTGVGDINFNGSAIDLNAAINSAGTGDINLIASSASNSAISGDANATINKTAGGDGTLTVRSNGRVYLNGAITNTSTSGVLDVVLWSDYGNTTSFGVSNVPAITTRGGHLWIGGSSTANGSMTWNGLTVGDGPSVGGGGGNANATDFIGAISTANGTSGGDIYVWSGAASGVSLSGNTAFNSINAGSGNITLRGNKFQWTAPLNVSTTGAFKFWSGNGSFDTDTGSFGQTTDIGWIKSNTAPSAFTWGGSSNNQAVNFSTTHYSTLTVAGPIRVYGGDITLNGNLTSTAAGAGISILASGDLVTGNALTFTTNGGALLLAGDTDSASGGVINFTGNVTANTNGGAITLGGGADGTGYAVGSGSTYTTAVGIRFRGSNSNFNSGGGDIRMRGKSFTSSGANAASGLWFDGSANINSGTGTITLEGVGQSTSSSGFTMGMMFSYGAGSTTTITSANTTADAIRLIGSAATAGNSAFNSGFRFYNDGTSITATGAGGGILLQGTRNTAGNANDFSFANSAGVGTTSSILAASGPIRLVGTTAGGNLYMGNMKLGGQAATSVPSSSSDVTLTFDGLNNVMAGSAVNTSGTLTIQPTSGSFASALTYPISNLTVSSNVSGLTLGKDLGSAAHTDSIALTGATTIAGPISIYAGSINLSANLTSTAAGARILAKASGNLVVDPGVSLQTNNGNLTLWADSDGNGGFIGVRENTRFNTAGGATTQTTGGGAITLAGGTTTDANGLPTGYAFAPSGTAVWGDRAPGGVQLGAYGSSAQSNDIRFYSGGGNIALRGKAADGAPGIAWYSGATGATQIVDAGAGTITLDGLGSTTGHGIELSYFSGSASPTLRSSSNATTAISVTGVSTTTGTHAGYQGTVSMVASGTGGISVNGTTSTGSNTGGVVAGTLNMAAASGAIHVTSIGGTGLNIGGSWGKGSLAASSSHITLTADKMALVTTSVDTSGTLTLEPYGNNFSTALSWPISGVTLASSVSGLTLGKDLGTGAHTDTITVTSATSIAGPINLYAGSINLNADLTSTAAGARILAKASGNIVVADGKALQSNGGDITLWADSDAAGGGYIQLVNNNRLDSRTAAARTANVEASGLASASGGGDITLGGGNGATAADGYALSAGTASLGGVNLGDQGHSSSVTTLYSGGGDVVVRGKQTGSSAMAVQWINGGEVNAGTGTVHIDGLNTGGGHGIELGAFRQNADVRIRASGGDASTPAIDIHGTGFGSGRGVLGQGVRLNSLGAGGINIVGVGGAGASNGIQGNNVLDVLAASGPITLDGGTQGITTVGSIGSLVSAPVPSGSNITLTGDRITFDSNGAALRTTGTVTLQPASQSFSSALTWLPTNLDALAPTVSGLTLGKAGNTANITIGSATTIGGPVALYGGNLAINAALTATNSTVSLHASGNVSEGGSITADALLLNGGNVALTAASNAVNTLAATGVGALSYTNSRALTLGTVGSTSGVNAGGAVSIGTHSGDLTVAANVATTNTTASALTLNAGVDAAAGTASGGNLVVSGSPTVSVGGSGRATLYSGSINGSSGLTALVGSGSGRFRYGSDETTQAYTLALTSGLNAIYREQPTVSLSLDNASITYGDSLGAAFSLSGGSNGDTAAQAFAVLPGTTVGGALSTSGNSVVGTHSIAATGGGSSASQLGYAGNTSGVSPGTLTVTARTLTATLIGTDRVYDGSTAAALTASDNRVGNDVLNVVGTGTFADADVGTAKAITVTGTTLSGADAANYTLSAGGSPTATISPKAVSISGLAADNKTYDGTSSAMVTNWGSVSTGVGSETLTLVGGSASFADANAGVSKTVTASGYTLADGSGRASNYTLTSSSVTTLADISKAVLTITANDDAKFLVPEDAVNFAGVRYSGFVNGETASVLNGSVSVSRSNPGDQTAGVYAGVLVPDISGLSATNYSFQPVNGTFHIVPSSRLLVRVTPVDGVYGSNPTYTLASASYYDGSAVQTVSLSNSALGDNRFEVRDTNGGSARFTVEPMTTARTGAGLVPAGSYSLGPVDIVMTNPQNFTGTVTVIGQEVLARRPLTPSVANGVTKVYDGSAQMNGVQLALGGLMSDDEVSTSGGGSFASPNAGTNLSYTVNGLVLTGTDAANYVLQGGTSFSGNDGSITPKTLTVSASKVYDGTTALNAGSVTLGGFVGVQTLGYSGATASSAHVADSGKFVNALTLLDGSNGGLAANYQLPVLNAQNAPVTITPAQLQASGTITGALSKVYDGTAAATGAQVSGSVTGAVAGDTLTLATNGITLAYDTAHVATATQISATGALGFTIDGSSNGSQASDYSFSATPVAAVAAQITPAPLQASGTIGGTLSKVYDGTAAAPGAQVSGSVTGMVAGDTLSLTTSGLTLAYNSAHVAGATQIGATGALGFAIDTSSNGSQLSDYSFSATPVAAVAAQITPLALQASGTIGGTLSKVYDGTAAAPGAQVTGNVTGMLAGDTLSLATNGLSLAYNSAHVASATQIGATGTLGFAIDASSHGSQASDYSLTASPVAPVAAQITPLALQASGVIGGSLSKVYDGTTAATGAQFTGNVTGMLAGDTLSMDTQGMTLAYNSAHVASATQISATGTLGFSIDASVFGSEATDYSLSASSVAPVAAQITPLALQASGTIGGTLSRVYDGTTAAAGAQVSGSVTGMLAGDTLSLATNGLSLAYNSAHVASATQISATGTLGFAIDASSHGSQASDYSLTASPVAPVAAQITPLALQASGTIGGTLSKVYDGTAAAAGAQVTGNVTGMLAGDTLSLATSGLSLAYNSAHVASATQISATGALGFAIDASSHGSQASDYSLTASPVAPVAGQITPLTLQASGTIGGTLSKVYDGTAAAPGAQVTGSVTGMLAGDTLSLSTSGLSLAYNSAHVASATQIGATGELGFAIDASSHGSQASDYSLIASPVAAVAAQITPLALQASGTIGGTLSKVYDGTTAAAGAQVSGSVSGMLAGDTLSLATNGLSLAYNSAHVASATQIGATGTLGFAIDASSHGSQASDYSLTASPVAAVAAQITPLALQASGTIGGTLSKVYDGTTAAAGAQVTGSVTGMLAGDTLSLSTSGLSLAYNSAHVASATQISATGALGFAIDASSHGSQASDYSLTASPVAPVAAQITPALLTLSASATGSSKVYDGSTAVGGGFVPTFGLLGLLAGDEAAASAAAAAYDSKNVGTASRITLSDITLGTVSGSLGSQASDYQLDRSSIDVAGSITPRALTVGLTGGSKVYDGHVQAPVGYSDDRVSGDALSVTGSATFADKNVGSGKTVTATGLTLGGADAGNYVLAANSATTLADITRLDSVQWIGGNSGNWFDPANWAGGAVPDLSNVANVVIPAGVLVDFNPAGLVAPAEAGPVNIDSLGRDGGLSMGGGSLVVGSGGVTLQTLVQNDGTLSTTGALDLGSLTQTGGNLSAQTGIHVNGPYGQTGGGTVTTPGAVTITSTGNPGSAVVLGNLNAGSLDVNSHGGAITQTTGTGVVVSGGSTLNAGNGDVTLDSQSNQLGGTVNVIGNNVTVVDGDGSLVVGTVNAGGTLQLLSPGGSVSSADGSPVPANRDATAIATIQQAGSVAVAAQALPPSLAAQAAPISAPAPLLTVAGAFDATAGAGAGTAAVPAAGAGTGAAAGGAVTGTSAGASEATSTAQGSASVALPASESGAPTLSVTLERLPSSAGDGSLRVLVPAALQASGFEFNLPLALTMALTPDQPVTAALRDGSPLPAWLQLDPATRSFRAQAVPAGALPLTVVVSAGGRRALMTLTPP